MEKLENYKTSLVLFSFYIMNVKRMFMKHIQSSSLKQCTSTQLDAISAGDLLFETIISRAGTSNTCYNYVHTAKRNGV